VDKELFTVRLDEYELPSLLIKVIKTMKKNGVTSIATTRIDKIITNFPNDKIGLNQFTQFKEGDKVEVVISLLYCTYP